MGQNFIIKGEKFSFEPNKWLIPIAEEYPALKVQFEKVRTGNYGSIKAKTEALAPIRSKWLGR